MSTSIDTVDGMCGNSVKCGWTVTPPDGWTGSCASVSSPIQGGLTACGPQAGDCSTNFPGGQPCNAAETVEALKITGGSCMPTTPQAPTLPPVTWGTAGEACNGGTPTGKGCGVGQCLPKPKAPFVSGMCIMHTGDVPQCPAGIFTERHVFYDPAAVQDTRSCTACSCDPPAGGTCSASIDVYSSNNCSGSPVATLHPTTAAGDCVNLSGNPTVVGFKAIFGAPTGGNCPAKGGQPQGTATPQSATTFCCVQ